MRSGRAETRFERHPRVVALLVAALVLGAGAAEAQRAARPPQAPFAPPGAAGRTYLACLERAAASPGEAMAEASAWLARGGGDAARHCLALALYHAGQHREAARALEDLAQGMARGAFDLRPELLAQAARAWLEADEPARAHAALSAALRLAPRNVDLHVDRAEVLASAGRWQEAIADLDGALAINPVRVDALALRAAAHRRLGALDAALADASRAIMLNPRSAEAYYERGQVHRARADRAAARADWARAIEIDRQGPVGEATRQAIQDMELGEPPADPPR